MSHSYTWANTERTSLKRESADGKVAFIPADPANIDYQVYLTWVEEGNTPAPVPEPEPAPVLTTEQKLEAAGLTVAELRELFGLD